MDLLRKQDHHRRGCTPRYFALEESLQAAGGLASEKTFPSSFFFWQDDLVAYQHAEAEDQVLGGFGDAGAFLLFGLFHGG